MGRINSKRRATETIYRSRQSGRTDIEELLGPNFDPEHQPVRPTGVVSASVGVTPTPTLLPSLSKLLKEDDLSFWQGGGTPTEVPSPSGGLIPSAIVGPAEGLRPPVGDTTAVGLPKPEEDEEGIKRLAVFTAAAANDATLVGKPTRTRLVAPPTVGVPPTVRDMAPSEIAPEWVSMSSGKSYPASRVKRIDIAQHSMSMGENHLYQALWVMHRTEYFRLLFESKQLRRFSAGYDVLARVGRLNEKSIRELLPKLKQKLVISEIAEADPMTRKGKTYEVFSYQQILARQREAGLCFVVNNGKAVEFAVPHQHIPVGATPRASAGVIPSVGVTPPEGQPHTESVGESPASSVGVSPTLLGKERQSIKQSSSSLTKWSEWQTAEERSIEQSDQGRESGDGPTPAALVEGIRQIVPFIDDEAVSLLWRHCRNRAHDCTAEEIMYFSHGKANILRSGKIQNPTGFLLIAVPKCFEGSSFQDYRRQREQARVAELNRTKQAESELEDAQRQLEEMLNSPSSSEEERRFAKRLLGLEGTD